MLTLNRESNHSVSWPNSIPLVQEKVAINRFKFQAIVNANSASNCICLKTVLAKSIVKMTH